MILASKSIMPTLVFPIYAVNSINHQKCLFQYLMFYKTRDFLLSFRVKTFFYFSDEAFDISCQETLSTGTVTPLTSPRDIVTPQSEQTACSPESRHSPRHFDNFTQRPGTKGDLSMEQSCCVSTPCQASNACDGLPCEETTFLGSLFENHKYSDEHRAEIGKTMGFLNERKLNSEGPTNTDSKGKDFQWLLFFLQAANNKI